MEAISGMLPDVVDRMTPQGRLPREDEPADAGALDHLLGSLGLGGQDPRRG
jgi:uncharacterized protein YidB (DUF937 family)